MPAGTPYKPQIERVVVVHNHTPETRKLAHAAEMDIREQLGLPVKVIQTLPGGLDPNLELFSQNVHPGDIVGGVHGDGTAKFLLRSIGLTPFISLAGGNARDIGRATHRRYNARPSDLIRRSVAVSALALHCVIEQAGETVLNDQAISYIGCGETARASARLESHEYRDRPPSWKRDFDLGMGSMRSSFSFPIRGNDSKEHRLSDLTFSNGPRMAKIGRFPVQYWEPHFRVTPVGEGAANKWVAAGGLLVGHAAGTYHQVYEFTPLAPVQMHFDGEPPVDVAADSLVRINPGDEFTIMTSRL